VETGADFPVGWIDHLEFGTLTGDEIAIDEDVI
jgi:hypothetical protein